MLIIFASFSPLKCNDYMWLHRFIAKPFKTYGRWMLFIGLILKYRILVVRNMKKNATTMFNVFCRKEECMYINIINYIIYLYESISPNSEIANCWLAVCYFYPNRT